MPIKIYNTLSRKKDDLPDSTEQTKIRLFVCGPTVYDYLHIGNARTYIFFDFFAKYLRSQGYEVTYLQNITDIDDKIIKRAEEENKKPEEVAKFFTEAYLQDMKALGIEMTADENEAKRTGKILYAPATNFIMQIVGQVERLIDKRFAYKIDDDGWYFDISKDKDYGKLSGRTVEQAEDGVSRIDEAVGKRNRGDFCLWKFSKEGEPSWNTSLGAGRPGWHIEDTAISEYYFGPQYDIHGGGVDLKFPHHEAEIAQQESASGLKPFVKIWMHVGVLLVDGKKMSKSLENFVTIRDFLKENPPEILRFIVFLHHYRSPLDYSADAIRTAKININALKNFIAKLEYVENFKDEDHSSLNVENFLQERYKFAEVFFNEDFNISQLLVESFGIRTEYEEQLFNMKSSEAAIIKKHVQNVLALLGFSFEIPQIPQKVQEKVMQRELSRASKQFEQSDALRKEIDALGYTVEDTPLGPFVWPKS